jgi:hypothetical protein
MASINPVGLNLGNIPPERTSALNRVLLAGDAQGGPAPLGTLADVPTQDFAPPYPDYIPEPTVRKTAASSRTIENVLAPLIGLAQIIGTKGKANGQDAMGLSNSMKSTDAHNEALWQQDYEQQLNSRAGAQKRYLELKQGQLLSQLDPDAPDYNRNVLKIYTQFNGPEAGKLLTENALAKVKRVGLTPQEESALRIQEHAANRLYDIQNPMPINDDLASYIAKLTVGGKVKAQQDAELEAAKQKAASDKASEDVARVVSPYLAVAEHVTPAGGIVGTANSIVSGGKSLLGMESPEKALQTLSISLAPAIQQKMMATTGRYNESLAKSARALLPSGTDSPGLRQIKNQFIVSLGDKNKSVEDAVNETTALVSKLYGTGNGSGGSAISVTRDFPNKEAAIAAESTLPAGTVITINGRPAGTVK